MKKIVYILIILLILLGAWFFVWNKEKDGGGPTSVSTEVETTAGETKIETVWQRVEVKPGSSYVETMEEGGVDYSPAMDLYEAAKDVYDLSKVKANKFLELGFDIKTDEFKEFYYQLDSEEEITAKKIDSKWEITRRDIDYEVKIKQVSGKVESSVYEAALDAGIDERAIINYAYAFQWTIDFAYDPRVGDSFEFIYEERFRNGEYVMPGKVLAGVYNNQGKIYYAYYFEESEENKGYFDENGNSVQKMFLKAPLEFKYISSGFTTGLRYVEAFNVSTGHRAIDYAASLGTPIRTVGAGTVTFAGWSMAGYGNLVSIRHNETYSTNYGHMSKILVKKGQRVEQGQTIGLVGSTGFSTGPHLHFEMVKNGVKINPLQEILPPGKAITEENMDRFKVEMEKYKLEEENN